MNLNAQIEAETELDVLNQRLRWGGRRKFLVAEESWEKIWTWGNGTDLLPDIIKGPTRISYSTSHPLLLLYSIQLNSLMTDTFSACWVVLSFP